jgi:hypothetical protein
MRVRIASLHPEVPNRVLKMVLGKYGDIRDLQEKTWSSAYRHPVANGIRIAMVNLVQHTPSHILVAGHRTLISYKGQPTTCYGCNETGHTYQLCPHPKRAREQGQTNTTTSWADVAAKRSMKHHTDVEDMEVMMDTAEPTNPEQQHAEEQSQAPKGGPPMTREGNDQTTEDRQVTVLNEEDTGYVTHTPPLQESGSVTIWTERGGGDGQG